MHDPILILNGPNLNLLGQREPDIYGQTTLAEIEAACQKEADALGLSVEMRQTNHEGEMLEWIHQARGGASGLIINAGAWTHSSVALHDALMAFEPPIIELHISNVFTRERFRHHSYLSAAATAVMCGFGAQGYMLALRGMKQLLEGSAS